MTGYALESMLRIRTMREDRAAAELTAARRGVELAKARLSEREAELAAYETEKEARRERIYDAVIGRTVTMDDLERAREGVARIDEEGALKADTVAQARTELDRSREAAEKTRRFFVAASKSRMKISEHRSMWLAEETAAGQYRQEAELEDFTGKKVIDDAGTERD